MATISKPAEVLTASERITWQEFVARLKAAGVDIVHIGVRIFNDPALKFETEVVNGKSEVWVSRRAN